MNQRPGGVAAARGVVLRALAAELDVLQRHQQGVRVAGARKLAAGDEIEIVERAAAPRPRSRT
jgi:hypothetical protein